MELRSIKAFESRWSKLKKLAAVKERYLAGGMEKTSR